MANGTTRVSLSTAMTTWAAPPSVAIQRIFQRGAYRLAKPRRDILEDGPCFGLRAPHTHSLEDAAQQVCREQATRALVCRSSPVSPVAESKCSADLRLCQAALHNGGIHRGACSSGRTALAIDEVQDHDCPPEIPRLDAASDKAGPDHASGRNAMHLPHLPCHKVTSEVEAARAGQELHQDGESHTTGPHASLPHLGEQPEAQLQVAGLHATLQQRVVHDLVTFELTGLKLFRQPHCLVEFTVAAIALDESAKRNQVWPNTRCRHLLKHFCSPMQVVCPDAGIDEAVEDNYVAQHTLHDHLPMKRSCCRGILGLGKALNESCVKDGVLVKALFLHH
mmetsp:Transcript_126247/g.368901  ORF Transcript_126247/g.368901 Transcript_126247/m.368901 type:complete len:336 (+) Transcript_126247:828-1835(+)